MINLNKATNIFLNVNLESEKQNKAELENPQIETTESLTISNCIYVIVSYT